MHASANGHKEAVELLLDHNADINAKDNNEGTPLHRACVNGDIQLIKLLLRKGADVYAKDADGKVPFDLCKEEESMHMLYGTNGEDIEELDALPDDRILKMLIKAIEPKLIDAVKQRYSFHVKRNNVTASNIHLRGQQTASGMFCMYDMYDHIMNMYSCLYCIYVCIN